MRIRNTERDGGKMDLNLSEAGILLLIIQRLHGHNGVQNLTVPHLNDWCHILNLVKIEGKVTGN